MKDLAGYLLVRLGVGLVGLLPGRRRPSLGGVGGLIWYLFGGDRKRMARRHMRRVLGPNGDQGRRTRQVFRSYGRYWAETLWVRPRRIPELDATLEIIGLEHLAMPPSGGKGAIIALASSGQLGAGGLVGPASRHRDSGGG